MSPGDNQIPSPPPPPPLLKSALHQSSGIIPAPPPPPPLRSSLHSPPSGLTICRCSSPPSSPLLKPAELLPTSEIRYLPSPAPVNLTRIPSIFDDDLDTDSLDLSGRWDSWGRLATLGTCVMCAVDIQYGESAQRRHCCNTVICAECVMDNLMSNPSSTFPIPCLNPNCEYHLEQDNMNKSECIVCFAEVVERRNKRKCCSQVVCQDCIKEIIRTSIEDEGQSHITCPNPECEKGAIGREEILKHISGETKEKYERFRLQEEGGSDKKTCPNCCLITEHKLPRRFRRYRAEDVRITCSSCQFEWCYRCHAPWHRDITCKQFQHGEKQFKSWTKATSKKGVANCHKCPLCRVYIQKSSGCNHMTCNRCKTEFCYRCGGFYNGLPGLGDHYTKTSIFGCSEDYKADSPIQRKTIRGGYLGAKLAMLTGYPVLFVAGLAVVVVVGVVALPIYGGYRFYKFKKRTNRLYRRGRK